MENVQPQPQCQFFVVRKKRLCRMTVRPGRSYCGEHEPKPLTAAGEDDTRVPCPYDSKHTCYASKLERHLAICNARPSPAPPYIVHNVNAPSSGIECERKPLAQVPMEMILRVVDKVHRLYEAHIAPSLTAFPEHPIHWAVVPEFVERGRTEASLRHLRQASSLLHIVEQEGMVNDGTCYVELGAGKGQLSLFAWRAWCVPRTNTKSDVTQPTNVNVTDACMTADDDVTSTRDDVSNSCVLLVDRAALRHKRDAKMRAETPAQDSPAALGRWCRVRADLSHVALRRVGVCAQLTLVGMAKHLCGAATDFALRCLVGSDPRGGVLATCCHHRCELQHYTGTKHLMELGLTPEELNVMLGVVSWATCGDGRARTAPLARTDRTDEGVNDDSHPNKTGLTDESSSKGHLIDLMTSDEGQSGISDRNSDSRNVEKLIPDPNSLRTENQCLDKEVKHTNFNNGSSVNSVLKIRQNNKVETTEAQHNVDDKTHDFNGHDKDIKSQENYQLSCTDDVTLSQELVTNSKDITTSEPHDTTSQVNVINSKLRNTSLEPQEHVAQSELHYNSAQYHKTDSQEHVATSQEHVTTSPEHVTNSQEHVTTSQDVTDSQTKENDILTPKLSQTERTEAGRRAKALLDWGRVLYLRSQGFEARLCHFVPPSVSLENVCIIAKKQC